MSFHDRMKFLIHQDKQLKDVGELYNSTEHECYSFIHDILYNQVTRYNTLKISCYQNKYCYYQEVLHRIMFISKNGTVYIFPLISKTVNILKVQYNEIEIVHDYKD